MTLAEYLDIHDLTFSAFARVLGAEQSMVQRWAQGTRKPSTEWANAVAVVTSGAVPACTWGLPDGFVKPPRRRNRAA